MAEHAEILRMLKEGNPDGAANALRSHVAVQGEKFHDLLSSYEKNPVGKVARN